MPLVVSETRDWRKSRRIEGALGFVEVAFAADGRRRLRETEDPHGAFTTSPPSSGTPCWRACATATSPDEPRRITRRQLPDHR
ncbi:DUF397 domain-containing protein [Haloechinothrix sp. YIM 98757]|uniref:DUF397 domain-containing protein n=1 Tax=Haloechinothrix aidingensis TaxID=2752311 RepID=A0A838AE90_9PSEU|nr:DUF397 domain-containing protein [Haloechinothrix aidingensis]